MVRKGFTLIELLVVIAIIAILAAILFPVFAQVREKARQISCVSNEKQMGLGILQYIQDYDESFPMNEYAATSGPNFYWTDEIQPYIKNGTMATNWAGQQQTTGAGGVFTCPSFPTPQQGQQYGVHDWLFPTGVTSWNSTCGTIAHLSVIDTPASSVMVVEKGQGASVSGSDTEFLADEGVYTNTAGSPLGSHDDQLDLKWDYDDAIGDPNGNAWPRPTVFPRYRHQGSCNMLFVDGHAKAIKKGTLNWYTNMYISGLMPAPY